MKYSLAKDGVTKVGTIVVRCRFSQQDIQRIKRAAKLRGTDMRYMLRSWLELVAEDELYAVEHDHGKE